MSSPTLLAIDGLNVIRRVYSAIPVPDSPQKAEGAGRSVLGTLRRVLAAYAPTHVAMAVDVPGQTWRHTLYPQYREGRTPMPVELRSALPDILHQIREQLGVHVFEAPGVEADDVLGTLIHRRPPGMSAVVLSSDKDLLQLVSSSVSVCHPFEEICYTDEAVFAKFGVTPSQIADFLALMGDGVDGVPGVPKIGQKIATKLIQDHGSLEDVLVAAQSATKGALARVKAHAELAMLSRALVRLKTDVPLEIHKWSRLRWGRGNE